ncbi:MAG TPA: Flp pilus assembly protein CpaB [Candidatus Binataceae bacterium]|nr:Flp pilus assembly protein CpaB [Candidatus Binataceae bacterium]
MRRPMLFVLLAGVAAMVAAVLVYKALTNQENALARAKSQNTQIVVASGDLPLGTKIEPSEVKLRPWPKDSKPDGAYDNMKDVIGSFVKNSFVANEPIVGAKLFVTSNPATAGVMPLLIPFGMRAVSVAVDDVSDISGFVLPHTRVDILVAMSGEGPVKSMSKIVLQNVEVLAVAQEIEKSKDEPTLVKTVTVLVTPKEAELLELASHTGSLRLAMRNYNDNKIVLTKGADVDQLIHPQGPDEPPDLEMQAPMVGLGPESNRPAPTEKEAEAAPPAPPPSVEVEILRNGKASESISFVNEAAKSSAGQKGKGQPAAPPPDAASDGAEGADAGGMEPPPAVDAKAAPPSQPGGNLRLSSAEVTIPTVDSSQIAGNAAVSANGGDTRAGASSTIGKYVPVPKTIDVP